MTGRINHAVYEKSNPRAADKPAASHQAEESLSSARHAQDSDVRAAAVRGIAQEALSDASLNTGKRFSSTAIAKPSRLPTNDDASA